VATRCISANEARRSIEWPVLLAIGASFAVGEALKSSGVATVFAGLLVQATRVLGPIAALAAIYVGTLILTEIISNNAAAVLAFPFCLETAALLGVSNRPFIIAVTLAASQAFASPIGYQTHMMVFGPGGYRFNDFVRVGVPLNILLAVVAVVGIPLVPGWRF
jgi:di/tricarboxylate transporter